MAVATRFLPASRYPSPSGAYAATQKCLISLPTISFPRMQLRLVAMVGMSTLTQNANKEIMEVFIPHPANTFIYSFVFVEFFLQT
jgi:hypothetical protein